MPRPFRLIESVSTPEGPLTLHQRGERDFMICIAGRVLMTSQIHRSELAVAELGCAPIAARFPLSPPGRGRCDGAAGVV